MEFVLLLGTCLLIVHSRQAIPFDMHGSRRKTVDATSGDVLNGRCPIVLQTTFRCSCTAVPVPVPYLTLHPSSTSRPAKLGGPELEAHDHAAILL